MLAFVSILVFVKLSIGYERVFTTDLFYLYAGAIICIAKAIFKLFMLPCDCFYSEHVAITYMRLTI